MPDAPAYTTSEFRSLVDKAIASCSLHNRSDVEREFHPDLKDIHPADWWEKLYDLIRATICTFKAGAPPLDEFRRLHRGLLYEVALGHPSDPYAPIMRTIKDACRECSPKGFDDEGLWLRAINAARALRVLADDLPEPNPRASVVLEAAKRLIASGATLRVEDGQYMMDKEELDRLSQKLDGSVRALERLPIMRNRRGFRHAG